MPVNQTADLAALQALTALMAPRWPWYSAFYQVSRSPATRCRFPVLSQVMTTVMAFAALNWPTLHNWAPVNLLPTWAIDTTRFDAHQACQQIPAPCNSFTEEPVTIASWLLTHGKSLSYSIISTSGIYVQHLGDFSCLHNDARHFCDWCLVFMNYTPLLRGLI